MSNAKIQLPYWCHEVLDDHRFDRFVITGGLGSAKTTNGLITFFLNILKNPHAKLWWVIAPVYSRVDDSVIPAITFGLSLLGMYPNKHYKLLRSRPAEIRILATDQVVMLLSADRPDTMVSATLGGYFITEAFRIKREVYENVESRTRSVKVERTLGMLEGTPEGDTWGKDEFNIDKYDTRRKLRRFILHTHDNAKNLHKDYIPRLFQVYAHSPAQIRSYIYGEFTSFRSGDVFAQWLESRNLIPDVYADKDLPLEFCFDFNATPLTWSAWQKQWYRLSNVTRQREICINESGLTLTSLAQAVADIVIKFPVEVYRDTEIRIWGDRTGHAKSHKASGTDFTNIKALMHEVGYRNVTIKAPRAITPIRASVDTLNKLFLYELALVCESCKNVRRSLNNTKWKQGTDDLEKPSGETHTHHSDGIRYRIYELYKGADINSIITNTVIGFNPI